MLCYKFDYIDALVKLGHLSVNHDIYERKYVCDYWKSVQYSKGCVLTVTRLGDSFGKVLIGCMLKKEKVKKVMSQRSGLVWIERKSKKVMSQRSGLVWKYTRVYVCAVCLREAGTTIPRWQHRFPSAQRS